MPSRIFVMEDEKELITEARGALSPEYQVGEVDVSQANNLGYWQGLGIMPEDLVVLDLNLREPTYSGLDVLRRLEDGKRRGNLPGLDKVLVATSIRGQVNPANPSGDIALTTGFDVYGLEKGVDASGRITPAGYGASLADKVESIYAGSDTPLNDGWRT